MSGLTTEDVTAIRGLLSAIGKGEVLNMEVLANIHMELRDTNRYLSVICNYMWEKGGVHWRDIP